MEKTAGDTLLQRPEQFSDKKNASTCVLCLRLSPYAYLLGALVLFPVLQLLCNTYPASVFYASASPCCRETIL